MSKSDYETERIERMIRVLENWIKKGEGKELKKYSLSEKKDTEKRIEQLKLCQINTTK